jgi:signal transduction histidine kinase
MEATVTWQTPRLRHDNRIVLGVAGGIADEIGVDAVVVRSGFVVLAVAGGWGVLLYLGAYAFMARTAHRHPDTAYVPVPKGSRSSDRVLGVLLAVVGLVLLIEALGGGFRSSIAWPTALVGLGALVVWYRGRGDSLVPAADGGSAATRIGAGLVLVGAGIVGLFALNVDVTAARDGLLLGTAVVAGLALVVAPSISRLVRDLAEERRRRVRSEERARVAAHLHDSVLQTLALIQRNPDDPAQMTALARRQERELREWLYGGAASSKEGTLRGGLRAACDEVEELHRVPIELVVVGGDLPTDDRTREIVAATREGLVNASRHADTPRIDVFAEATPEAIEVYVRDQGRGFDPGSVPADRQGVRESIVARMQRAGGAATILSSPDSGTEVELRLPLGPA